jgi:hypothetical protein
MWPNEIAFGDLTELGSQKRPLDVDGENSDHQAKRVYTQISAEQNPVELWTSSQYIPLLTPQNEAIYCNNAYQNDSSNIFPLETLNTQTNIGSINGPGEHLLTLSDNWASFGTSIDWQHPTKSLGHEQHIGTINMLWDQNGVPTDGFVSSNNASSNASCLPTSNSNILTDSFQLDDYTETIYSEVKWDLNHFNQQEVKSMIEPFPLAVNYESASKAFESTIIIDSLSTATLQTQESEEGTPSCFVRESTQDTSHSQENLDIDTWETAPTSECSSSSMDMDSIQMGRITILPYHGYYAN